MTVEQVCTLFNIAGVVIPLVFSLGFALFHQEAYFRSWTLSYALLFVTLMADLLSQPGRAPLGWCLVEVVAYLLSAWLCLKMSDQLASKPRSSWVNTVLASTMGLAYLVASAGGHPFEQGAVPAIMFYIGTQVVLGIRILRNKERFNGGRIWMGTLVILTGLWVLAYPMLLHAGIAAAGFVMSGLLHIVLGMGMILLLLTDIAHRLQRHNDELQVIERLQTEFISNMTHEFRTPINAIKTAAWLLANAQDSQHLSERQRETIEMLGINADRINNLVSDVLDFSKLASGTMSYECELTDVNMVLNRAAQALKHLFESKGVKLAIETPEEPVCAAVDGKRIGQVVTNLLSNALKFTDQGGAVNLRLATEGEEARIEVLDTGIGIDDENLEKVFTKFYQVDGSTRRKAEGTGLGLTICKAIIEEGHHGRIWAEHRGGGPGTRMVATFPL